MRLRRVGTGVAIVVLVGLIASHAWAQESSSPGTKDQPESPVTEPRPTTPSAESPIFAYPVELFGLLAPPAQRGKATLMPSITVSEEYNDNIFSDNQNRQSDFITNFTPAITLSLNDPSYHLSAGYTFTGQFYAEESQLNEVLQSQNLVLNGSYAAARGLTFTASDSFAYNRDTGLLGTGFSTGRQESWSNTFSPGMTWQMTQRNSLNLGASFNALRFEGTGAGADSDTYGVHVGLNRALTPRLSGNIGYGFTYLDDHTQQNSTTTHTPLVGLGYQLTPTLSATAGGGPSITDINGEIFVSPTVNVSLVQALKYGSASLNYTSGVAAAGGFGGTNLAQTLSGRLALSGWERGLAFVVNPAFHTSDSLSSRQTNQVDVKTVTLTLAASYQIWRFISIVGEYTFLWQRTGSSSATQLDVDQNRVRFGLQFGYPINFD